MKKVFGGLLLLITIISCKKEPQALDIQPPDFFYKKTKQNLPKDSTVFYLNILKKIPYEQLSDSLQAEYAFTSFRFYLDLHDYDSAIERLIFATSFTKEKIRNSREVLYFRALKEMYFRRKNDYLNAAGVNEKMGQLLDSTDYRNRAYIHSFNQQIQRALGKTEEALLANEQSIRLFLKAKDTLNYLIFTLDQAAILTDMSKYAEAQKELDKVFPYEGFLITRIKYQLYGTEGFIYTNKKQYRKALNSYKKALLYSKQLNSTIGLERLTNTYLNIANTYLKLHDYEKSKIYIDSVFTTGMQYMSFTDQQEALRAKLEITYEQREGFEKVIPQLDSLFSFLQKNSDTRINNELQVLKEAFDNERNLQEEKNRAEVKSLKLQRNQYFLIALLLILIVLVILVINFYKQRRFSMEKQNFLLQQRLLRSQMNPHFVFNSLSVLKQGVEQNKEQYTKYIVKLSRLLRTVFDNSTKDNVLLEDELQSLEDYIELQKFRFPNRFDYIIENTITTENELFIPPMLLQPFVENAIIHGFGKLSTKGSLHIHLSKQKKWITYIVNDNGVGMKNTLLKKKSSMYLIDQFLFKMTGKRIVITNTEDTTGTQIEIKIPYTEL